MTPETNVDDLLKRVCREGYSTQEGVTMAINAQTNPQDNNVNQALRAYPKEVGESLGEFVTFLIKKKGAKANAPNDCGGVCNGRSNQRFIKIQCSRPVLSNVLPGTVLFECIGPYHHANLYNNNKTFYKDCMTALLECGADINKVDNYTRSVLSHAVLAADKHKDNDDACKFIMAFGSGDENAPLDTKFSWDNFYLPDKFGKTPLQIAESRGNERLTKQLEEVAPKRQVPP